MFLDGNKYYCIITHNGMACIKLNVNKNLKHK